MNNAIIGRVEDGQSFREVVKEMLGKVPDGVRVSQIRYYSPDEALLGLSMMDNQTGYMVVFIDPVETMPVGTIIMDTVLVGEFVGRENDLETKHR